MAGARSATTDLAGARSATTDIEAGACTISPSVQTTTVSVYSPTEPAKTVRPKPQAISSEPTPSRAALPYRRTSLVTGIWSTTITRPLTAMTVPNWRAERPCAPMSMARVELACCITEPSRKVRPTRAMKRWSRRTSERRRAVGSAERGEVALRGREFAAFPLPYVTSTGTGSVSCAFTYTTTAHSTVVSASPTNSHRYPSAAMKPAAAAETPKPMLIAQ